VCVVLSLPVTGCGAAKPNDIAPSESSPNTENSNSASESQPESSESTRDPFIGYFEECLEALQKADVPVELHILKDMPHGFGYRGGWIPDYYRFLTEVFTQN